MNLGPCSRSSPQPSSRRQLSYCYYITVTFPQTSYCFPQLATTLSVHWKSTSSSRVPPQTKPIFSWSSRLAPGRLTWPERYHVKFMATTTIGTSCSEAARSFIDFWWSRCLQCRVLRQIQSTLGELFSYPLIPSYFPSLIYRTLDSSRI